MRVSRTRFSKRRSKRKTEFPLVAVVQKKRKPEYSVSHSFSVLRKKTSKELGTTKESYENQKLAKQSSPENLVENDKIKNESLPKFEQGNSTSNTVKNSLNASSKFSVAKQKRTKPQKKSRATIDYKNVILLRNLITAEGKILPRRINKLTAKQQRSVQKAIKSARIMGLVPFINKSRPFSKF